MKAIGPQELDLEVVATHHVCVGDQTWIFWKM